MFRLILFSAWVWGYTLARFIIWSHRWEGIRWIPNPNASSWYALTDLKYKPKPKHLKYIFYLANGLTLASVCTVPEDIRVYLSLIIIHIISAIWWPAFIELKFSWKSCVGLAVTAHGATVYMTYWFISRLGINLFLLFPISLSFIQAWMVYISAYALIVVKEPTLQLRYMHRQSRPIEV